MSPLLSIIDARILSAPDAPLDLSDEELDALSDADIAWLQEHHGGTTFLRMPPRERAFFDWLHAEDPDVWNDLWEDDHEMCVSFAFLADLRAGGPGFLICELEQAPNYFFTPRHVRPEGLAGMQAVLGRVEKGGEVAVGEALMLQILARPTDLWHFCHRFGVPVARAKAEVAALAAHQWLVHLESAEELLSYLQE
jgi:hypothetical protein